MGSAAAIRFSAVADTEDFIKKFAGLASRNVRFWILWIHPLCQNRPSPRLNFWENVANGSG